MIEKIVNIEIAALETTAVKAVVTEYREKESVVVYDLFNATGNLAAKSRYSLIDDAPFELSEEDIVELNPVEESEI